MEINEKLLELDYRDIDQKEFEAMSVPKTREELIILAKFISKILDHINAIYDEAFGTLDHKDTRQLKLFSIPELIEIEKQSNNPSIYRIRKMQSYYPLICPECDHTNIPKESTLHLYEYYVEPYSCAGGDYYREDRFCKIKCASCNSLWSLYKSDLPVPREAFDAIETHRPEQS